MPKQQEDDKNSVCSVEEVEVKDKEEDVEEEEKEEEEEDEEEDEEEEEDDDEEEEEFDQNIINYELLKNFFIDEDGTNVSTHLGAISKELRTLNKILLKKNKD
jgi:hypothetical protein